ncbi:Apolipoprotein B-100 [Rhizoctonia solani]|uniref:Apolipoprotein B-100 n=1 Tax=Rhizoctonia solani TaxID=456999 RepID=A0A0K6FZG5_9AGAM|nr:Apolipoprotein B-100 [Rhizoctonia solani]
MGKSRMVEEAGKTVFTIPINIREEGELERDAYPPPDNRIRLFFQERANDDDKIQQAHYMIFLQELFALAHRLVNTHFPGLTGAILASKWADYLAEGQTDLATGPNRQQFYNKAVDAATAKISKSKSFDLAELATDLRTSCRRLIARVRLTSDEKNACFVYFDEAHPLTQAIKNPSNQHKRNQFHNLGKVLSHLINYKMFFIFLSTNSSLKDLAPPVAFYRSERKVVGEQLIAPFTELPFDIHENNVIPRFKSRMLTLKEACKVDVMVLFGRALWFATRQVDSDTDVYDFAMHKLTAKGSPDYKADSMLAALGVRVGIEFDGKEIAFDQDEAIATEKPAAVDEKSAPVVEKPIVVDEEPTVIDEEPIVVDEEPIVVDEQGAIPVEENHSYWVQSRLVESHMRVAYSIPQHRGYMHTGAPSEPVLAEAAGRYLSGEGRRGIAIEGPIWLSDAHKKGFLARGERGELVSRLLVTVAHDIALEKHYGKLIPKTNVPCYHRPIPVVDFLCALFTDYHHDKILGATPISRQDGETLKNAFSGCYVSFSHFALAGDSKMLSVEALATALVRGMALQAKEGQESIDAVIPIHMGLPTVAVSADRTSAINLQIKNRKGLSHCNIKRSITVPDTKVPAISIILELGIVGEKSGTIELTQRYPSKDTRSTGTDKHDDHHYEIRAFGCTRELFKPVTKDTEPHYKALLGAGSVWEDFARCDQPNNVAALRAMKPVVDGEQQVANYYDQPKPKPKPTSNRRGRKTRKTGS